MKKRFLSILFCFISVAAFAHPLHVSVLNIIIEKDQIRINLATFSDDWEVGYFHYFSKPTKINAESFESREWFEKQLFSSFAISESEESPAMEIEIDSISFNELSMTLEMHIPVKKEIKSLYIYNAILTDIFADQSNLVIISRNKQEKGIKFDYKKRYDEVKFR